MHCSSKLSQCLGFKNLSAFLQRFFIRTHVKGRDVRLKVKL